MKTEQKSTDGGERQGIKLSEVPYEVLVFTTEGDAMLAEIVAHVGDAAKVAQFACDAINDAAKAEAVNASGVADITSAVNRLKRVGKEVTPERVAKLVAVIKRQREELAEAIA